MKKKLLLFIAAMLASFIACGVGTVSLGAQAAADDPVIIDLGDSSRTKWWVDEGQGVNAGKHSFVTVDGTPALKLDMEANEFGMFHIMFEMKDTSLITDAHKYVRITYMTDSKTQGKLTMQNLGNGSDFFVFSENVSLSGGKWVRSNAVEITSTTIARLNKPQHVSIKFDTADANSNYYIKEMAFFTSEEAAYKYYGDTAAKKESTASKMTFGPNGNAFVRYDAPEYGTSVYNETTGAVDITYCSLDTNITIQGKASHYMAKVKFNAARSVDNDQVFVRVLYSAKHPAGVDAAELAFRNDGTGTFATISTEIKDTNGEFVLTPTVELPIDFIERFGGYNGRTANHVSVGVSTPTEGGVYSLKTIYFFNTKESADAFTAEKKQPANISINGNNISLYQIVISKDASYKDTKSAGALKSQIQSISGIDVPIVKDDGVKTLYEILVGQSNRERSYSFMKDFNDGADYAKRYYIGVFGNTLVISAGSPAALESAVDFFNTRYLYSGNDDYPAEIKLGEDCNVTGIFGVLGNANNSWAAVKNVSSPITFKESFDADNGYFVEHSLNSGNFTVANGVLSASAKGEALAYMQVYEKNAIATAEFKFANAASDADLGLMLRYVGTDAYIKGGYDFAKGAWYISFREGADFYEIVCASAAETLDPARTYTVSLKADGANAELSVNGAVILTASGINHITPGRPAVFAENIDITVDNFALTSLSGTGTIIPSVIHTNFSENNSIYKSSVTFIEMKDGTINAGDLKSNDGGKTWSYNGAWTKLSTVDHFIRLNDGRLANVARDGGSWCLYTSEDEGKNWVKQGAISTVKHPELGVAGGNQNDKLTQGASGRLYYALNYESSTDLQFTNDGIDRVVFGEFFFSDDLGKTWYRSDTSSWEIKGNEQAYKFGETKMIECADGTIRLYSSWSDYGCIVYSESNDGGKTFGPLEKLTVAGTDELFRCARSSMQLTRDMYGETDFTYYMVWVNAFDNKFTTGPKTGVNMPRNGLSLAKSTDGKNWEVIGDIWRWESAYTSGLMINHIVNPSIAASKDSILVGTGLSEYLPREGDPSVGQHGAQRQHVWSIPRSSLENTYSFKDVTFLGSFTDVHTGCSYYDAVKFAVDNGLFNGTSATTFSPDAVMNRAMFVTVLGRLGKVDVSAYTKPTFGDVVAGQWYTSYVEWAAANSIVNGIGNGLYGVDGAITVEQACTILGRFGTSNTASKLSGKQVSDFADSASVSSWAADGVKWAVENGIYAGTAGKLNPTSPASRALVATMFANYVKAFG